MEQTILEALNDKTYQPLKPKALARKLKIPSDAYAEFRQTLKRMVRKGQIEVGKKHHIRPASRHSRVIGVFRSLRGGRGVVRPRPGQGVDVGEIAVKSRFTADAATGDVVQVAITRQPRAEGAPAVGQVVEVVERAAHDFVGTLIQHDSEYFVRVDGGIFHEDIYVGDAPAKGARVGDKVVFEMLRFPSPEMFGEGVVTEVLGKMGEPDVDLKSVIRQFQLPDDFPKEVLDQARAIAQSYPEQDVTPDRTDLTAQLAITIDPPDAKDFDDAVHVERDNKGFWTLWVHIADVSTFVSQGSPLDREARRRGTSVYLPGKVLPMLPELISNGLASLQQGRRRYTKTVRVEFDPQGRMTDVAFLNSVIQVKQRLTYRRVMAFLDEPDQADDSISDDVKQLLLRMRDLYRILRARRWDKGFLELAMPEAELDYDKDGRVAGAHFEEDDESHQLIAEFMLTANEAVARKLEDGNINFLRRVHEIPDPLKLRGFADFVRSLELEVGDYRSRHELQRILLKVKDTPQSWAVNYALLRSLKIAVYSPEKEGHFGVASDCYCHFTSPIRRYPDLVVHRLLDQWIRRGKAGSDYGELLIVGEHCSFTERRAEKAERELIKIKLLHYLEDKVGETFDMVITGVEQFGFFAMGTEIPAEGLVHIRTLTDDFYQHDPATYSLIGKQRGTRYRLGDSVRCVIVKVDHEYRQLDLRVADPPKAAKTKTIKKPSRHRKRKRQRR